MIVERKWSTEKWTNDTVGRRIVIKSQWVGWFLFGVIPLYIKQTSRAVS